MNNQAAFSNPFEIVRAGERIYEERYKDDLERSHLGQFVAINIRDGKAYCGRYAEDALQEAEDKAPYGVFHLIHVGSHASVTATLARCDEAAWSW